MNPESILGRIWNAIPNGLKKFIGYGIAAGIASSMVIFLFLVWGTGFVQEKLNIPTKHDVDQAAEELRGMNEEDMQRAINTTVAAAMDSAAKAQDALMDAMVRDVIEPGIERQNRLFEQVRALNRKMGINNDLLDQQAARTSETADVLQQLQTLMRESDPRNGTQELLRRFERYEQNQEQIMKKMKISKQTM